MDLKGYRWKSGFGTIYQLNGDTGHIFFVDDKSEVRFAGIVVHLFVAEEILRLAGEVERLELHVAQLREMSQAHLRKIEELEDGLAIYPDAVASKDELIARLRRDLAAARARPKPACGEAQSPLVVALDELKANPFRYPAGLPEEDPGSAPVGGFEGYAPGDSLPGTECIVVDPRPLLRLAEAAKAVVGRRIEFTGETILRHLREAGVIPSE